jgi:hypothetical protein
MEVGSPEWIEASLARLDELERERAQHEAALETVEDPAALKRHTEAFTRLDTEIKSLYAQLEAVADDDDEGDEESEADVETSAPRATQGDDELSAPHFSAMATPAPAPAPAVKSKPAAKPVERESDNPFGSPSPSPSGGGGFDAPAPISMGDDDLKPAGGGAKWAFLGLLVIAGAGVGGYFVWQDMQSKAADAAPASTEPEKVIRAAGVPDDTEAPPTAPSGQATISPNANPTATDAGKKKKKDEEDKPNPLKLKGGDGPL